MYFELLDGIYINLNLFFSCRSNNEWVPPYVPGTLKNLLTCVQVSKMYRTPLPVPGHPTRLGRERLSESSTHSCVDRFTRHMVNCKKNR